MLLIIFAAIIFITLCLIIGGILPNSSGRPNKTSPKYIARQPPQVYYTKQEKKVGDTTTQATTTGTFSSSPRAPYINEFYRPRCAVNLKDIVNSKFNYQPERKRIDRTQISGHDEEVYREAERLRIQRESRIAEERNRRWFAQKQFERNGQKNANTFER